ncbi:MAG: prephenate dehydratase [Crocinitomicaceae bacterium]|nr:prephenate dehydratase [Crocinitomicaceae bacterium]
MKQKIAIQGVKGAFHEEAAQRVFGSDIEIVPCADFKDEIELLQNGSVDAALMAIENTISGTILNNYELIRQSGVPIVGETNLRIHQNLGGIPGSSIFDLTEVSSHYMALNQCREFFKLQPKIQLVEASDTALSIQEVAEIKDRSKGAIGSKLAIEYYGLEILAENIETHKDNYTRFAVLSKSIKVESGNKVSLSIVLKHESGILAKALSLLHRKGINLTKIESSPVIGKPFQYRFYLDLLLEDVDGFETALNYLKPLTIELNILGRYKHEPLNK